VFRLHGVCGKRERISGVGKLSNIIVEFGAVGGGGGGGLLKPQVPIKTYDDDDDDDYDDDDDDNNKPNIIVVVIIIRDNEKEKFMSVDVVISGDRNVTKKEAENISKI
jgi:hypothetical protein